LREKKKARDGLFVLLPEAYAYRRVITSTVKNVAEKHSTAPIFGYGVLENEGAGEDKR